jgi:Cu-Zn family superoxide dismutase
MKVFSLLMMIFLSFSAVNKAYSQEGIGLLVNNQGMPIGEVTLFKAHEGVLLRLRASKLDASGHGIHFHEKADCSDLKEFKSAGGHIMLAGEGAGYYDENGPHAGNLPNIYPGIDGKILIEIYSNLVSMDEGDAALFDEDGSAIVIHQRLDDYKSMTAAGPRIACAAIKQIKLPGQ